MHPTVCIKIIPGSQAALVVDPFYEQEAKSHRARANDLFFVAFMESIVVGVCRLCIEEDTPLLRSMVVHSSLRSQKIGATILKSFAKYLDENNLGPVYCLPYEHLESFYGLIEFKVVREDEGPQFLQERLKLYRKNAPDRFMMMKRN